MGSSRPGHSVGERFHFGVCRFDKSQQGSYWSNELRRSRANDRTEQLNSDIGKHATVPGHGNWCSEYGSHLESRWWSGLHGCSMWYDFGRRTLHPTGECTLPRNTQCDRDQRGRPNQISFGKRDHSRSGCDFTEYYADECSSAYSEHGFLYSERDGHDKYGGGLELEWSRLQRRLLWIPGDEFTGGGLYRAAGGTCAAERYRSGDQHCGTD